jgi:hypothetical protein
VGGYPSNPRGRGANVVGRTSTVKEDALIDPGLDTIAVGLAVE